jgi:hypothetical protein
VPSKLTSRTNSACAGPVRFGLRSICWAGASVPPPLLKTSPSLLSLVLLAKTSVSPSQLTSTAASQRGSVPKENPSQRTPRPARGKGMGICARLQCARLQSIVRAATAGRGRSSPYTADGIPAASESAATCVRLGSGGVAFLDDRLLHNARKGGLCRPLDCDTEEGWHHRTAPPPPE